MKTGEYRKNEETGEWVELTPEEVSASRRRYREVVGEYDERVALDSYEKYMGL